MESVPEPVEHFDAPEEEETAPITPEVVESVPEPVENVEPSVEKDIPEPEQSDSGGHAVEIAAVAALAGGVAAMSAHEEPPVEFVPEDTHELYVEEDIHEEATLPVVDESPAPAEDTAVEPVSETAQPPSEVELGVAEEPPNVVEDEPVDTTEAAEDPVIHEDEEVESAEPVAVLDEITPEEAKEEVVDGNYFQRLV
jgi:hypothetical protein